MTEVAEAQAPSAETQRLAQLGRPFRRSHGIVYTPDALVSYVLDQVFGGGNGPSGLTLDPACGTGAFLRAVVRRIAADLVRADADLGGRDREGFLARVSSTVWGVDLDEVAVHLARLEMRSVVLELSPGPLSSNFFDRNVIVGDFLGEGFLARLPGLPRHIVGNPPYVTIDRISTSDRTTYRGRFLSAFGRIDLYTLFMERSSQLLEPGGNWGFITPDKFLSSVSARPIRELLTRTGSFTSFTLFDSHRVFADAATVPCVSVWKAGPISTSPATMTSATVDTTDRQPFSLGEPRHIPQSRLLEGTWTFHRRGNRPLAERLLAGHTALRHRTTRISAGLATGYNPAFVVNAETASRVESQLIHRTVRGRDIRAYAISPGDEFLLLPYTWNEDDKPELIELDRYPLAHAWLEGHRDRLEARHCVRRWGKAWWDLHDPVGLPLHRTEKIVVPDLAKSNRFAVDRGRYIPQHSAYYMIPDGISATALAAILNSPAIEFLIRSSAPLVKDGFSRYRRQFLVDLPVPSLDDPSHAELTALVEQGDYSGVSRLSCELFGASLDEVQTALDELPNGR